MKTRAFSGSNCLHKPRNLNLKRSAFFAHLLTHKENNYFIRLKEQLTNRAIHPCSWRGRRVSMHQMIHTWCAHWRHRRNHHITSLSALPAHQLVILRVGQRGLGEVVGGGFPTARMMRACCVMDYDNSAIHSATPSSGTARFTTTFIISFVARNIISGFTAAAAVRQGMMAITGGNTITGPFWRHYTGCFISVTFRFAPYCTSCWMMVLSAVCGVILCGVI